MNNLNYAFYNTGYKIHLPVVPDSNDPLTRKIADFLDQKFGLQPNTNSQYETSYYKIGCGGELEGGKGITLYGKNASMQEMQELAQEIEQKFGKELADNVKKYNITFDDPMKLSNSVQARFAAYNHTNANVNAFTNLDLPDSYLNRPFSHNYCMGNKSGALPRMFFTTQDGTVKEFSSLKKLSVMDKKFFHGDSTLYAIDNFGEFFTGKIENGKVPQFIMDGLPKEYLQHYNITEKDIIDRIHKGTKQIVANMLEDAVNNPNSKILQGNLPWLATLDTQVIDEAKQLLAQHEPQTVQKLEQILPQLEKQCPALSVLKKTTPFAQMKTTPVQTTTVNSSSTPNPVQQPKSQVNPNNPVNPNATNPVNSTPKTQTNPKPNGTGNTPKVGWFEKLGNKGKVGLAVVGTALVAGSIYELSRKDTPKKAEVKQDTSMTQLNQQQQPTETYQKPYKNAQYNNYYGYYNPYQSYSMSNFRI